MAAKTYIRMTELAKLLNRESSTVRKWETEGLLPEALVPARDANNHRIWTKTQVKGIVKWMEDTDMRPGRLMADPDKEEEHIEALHTPKLLNGDQIRGVRRMVANGRSREYIVKRLFPRTEYSSPANLDKALARHFKRKGWEFPKKQRRPYPPAHLRMGQPGPKPKSKKAKAKQARIAAKRRRVLAKY